MCRSEQFEAVGHVQLVAAAGVFGDARQAIVVADFADHRRVRVLIEQAAQALQELEVLRLALVELVPLPGVRIDRRHGRIVTGRLAARRVVAQLGVVEVEVDGVESVAVDAEFEPELHGFEQRVLHFRVVEVQIGLAGQEVVQVVLAATRIPLPGAAAENRQPIVRRIAVLLAIGPHVPVGLGIVAALTALDKPRVRVRRVREHLVDHHLEAEFMRTLDQRADVVERAEHRVDVAVVADVVAEVFHRALEERRQPDRIDSKPRYVFELAGDARQVADAVAVAVGIAARVDLVDDAAAPPVVVRSFLA